MRRFFIGTILIIVAVGVGWYYAPQNVRERLLGFAGIAGRRTEVKNFVEDLIPPLNPEERRRVLTEKLKKNIGEIRRRTTKTTEKGSIPEASVLPDEKLAAASTEEIVKAAEEIVKELEEAAGDRSVGGTILERVIERILPPPEPVECKPVK